MALEQVGVQFIAAGGDVYITTLNSATKSTNTFVDATEHGGGRVGAAGQVMIGALRQVGTIAVQAFEQAAKATAAFVGESISVAGDFEAGMKKFQAVAGKGVDTKGLEKFKDLFISLGKELPVSTSEVEQAAIEMVSGGIDPAIVAGGALRQTIQFAAASGLSLADAAKTSAKFLAGWTASAATAEEKIAFLALSTDTLTKAAAASSTTAAELRLGLFNMQGAAQALHVSFEDSAASLALLAPAFESSAQAGTALNVFMTRLVPSTAPATAAMQDLGLMSTSTAKIMDFLRSKGIQPLGTDLDTLGNQFTEYAASQDFTAKATQKLWDSFSQSNFFDAQGNFAGMSNAAQLLKEKLGGLSDEQKIDTLHTIFGNDAMKVANLLMQDGAKGLDGMIAKMHEANGVSDTAALMQSGYNTALENAKGSVEAFQITIGSKLLPVLTDLFNNTIAPAINTLTDFASALFGSDEAFNKLSPDLQAMAAGIGILIGDVQNIVGAFNEAGAKSSEFGESIGLLATDLGLPGQLIEDIIFGVQKLVGWFSSASSESKSLDGVLTDLNGVWGLALKTVQDVGAGYMAIANAVLPIIQNLWKAHGTEISAFLKTTYDTVISIVRLALQLYDAIVPPILNTIAGFFRDHGSEIEKILSGAGQAIGAIVTGTMETIKGIFQLALDLIHGDWKAAWGDIEGIASAQAKAIGGVITGFLNLIAGLFNTSLADIGKTWSDNWNSMVDLVGKIGWWEAGKSVVDGLKKGIDDAWDSLMSWFNNKVSGLVDAAMEAIGAGSPAKEFMPVGAFAIQGIMVGMESMVPALSDLINQTGNEMIAALTKNIEEGGDKIRKELEQLTKDIKSIAAEINGAIADAFGATASVDRQKVANIKAVAELSPAQQAGVQSQINAAEQIARAMNDPKEAAAYFAMRSKQLIELGKLSQEINAATDMQQRAMLQAQYDLINDAQNAEMKGFDANAAARTSPIQDIADQLAALFSGSDVASKLPGILESPLVSQVFGLLDQLRNASVSPPATGYNGVNGISNFTDSRTYSMPIYTNQSPSVIQDSFAVQQAVMP